MTAGEDSVFLAVWLLLTAALAAGAWLCFRRTRIRSFLFLGAVLVLWPWFDAATEALRKHFLDQLTKGNRLCLFPFSLMRLGDAGWTGWQMSPGEFLAKFNYAKQLLFVLLLAIAFAFIARALKKLKPNPAQTRSQ